MGGITIIQQGAKTSTGTQDFTSSETWTPSAAIVIFGGAQSGNNPADVARMSIGFTDGTTDASVAVVSEDGKSRSDTKSYQSLSHLVQHTNVEGAISARAEFDSWLSGGMRINWSLVDGLANYVTVILFDSAVYGAKVGGQQLNGASPVAVSGVGFKATTVIALAVDSDTLDTPLDSYGLSVGAAHNSATDVISQATLFVSDRDTSSTTLVSGLITNDTIAGYTSPLGTVGDWSAAISAYGADGFTLTGFFNAATKYVFYLALHTADADSGYVEIIDTPTSTGVQSYDGPGFTPEGLLLFMGPQTTVNNEETSGDKLGSLAIGAADGTNEFTTGFTCQDASADSNTRTTVATAKAAELFFHDQTDAHAATLDSFDADGFNLDFTITDGTARKWIAIAFEATALDPTFGFLSPVFPFGLAAEPAAVTADVAMEWDIRNNVLADVATEWHIRNNVLADVAMEWMQQANVYGDVAAEWHIRSNVYADAALEWNIRNNVQADVAMEWDIRNNVVADLALEWDIRQNIYADLVNEWNIVGYGVVATIGLHWDMVGIDMGLSECAYIQIPAEDRIKDIPAEIRHTDIPAEDRRIDVLKNDRC